MFITRSKYEELEQKLEEALDDKKTAEKSLESYKEIRRKELRDQVRATEILGEHLEDRDAKIEVLEKNQTDRKELYEKEQELKTKEELVNAQATRYAKIGELVTEAEDAKTKHGEARYKNGYADGLADGLRKAYEITAEDRKQANTIALVAAASHSTESVQEIMARADTTKALGDGKNGKDSE